MTSQDRPSALIAEDEPLLRDELIHMLNEVWPELEIVAAVRNGREAVKQFELLKPDICFLDVHMPGLSGIDAARLIGHRAHLIFVTAYDQYALQAFDRGALDYLMKPIEKDRLMESVRRLKIHFASATPPSNIEDVLSQLTKQMSEQLGEQLSEQMSAQLSLQIPANRQHQTPIAEASALRQTSPAEPLRWIRAQLGQTLKLISVERVDFLRADEKYTLVGWHNDMGTPLEDLIRTPLRELLTQLDPQQFVQVHRAVVVNLHAVSHVLRNDNETALIYLKGRATVLPVSRTYLHHFRQM